MSGYDLITRIRRLELVCDRLGLEFAAPRYHGGYHGDNNNFDTVSLQPKDEVSLPIYNRDAAIFTGTLHEVEYWTMGVQWARDYDRMIFGDKHGERRERREQDYRNQRLVKILKENNEQSNG